MRSLARGHAARQISLDVLHHHDRIVDDDTDRQHQAEQRQHVQREAEGVEEGEGADERHRDRDDRDDRRAPGLQEDENDDGDENRRLGDRLVDLVDRFRDELGRVVDDPVFRPSGKSRDTSVITFWICSAASSALVPGREKMPSATAGLPSR